MNTKRSDKNIFDCLIIGAGPAGISAALYLHRFLRTFALVDGGESRMLKIPETHNYPGFTQGIAGKELLKSLTDQLHHYKLYVISDFIRQIERDGDYFIANGTLHSKTIILATGIKDISPVFPDTEKAIKKGLIRFCPVCDAYEVRDKHIGVLGHDSNAIKEAMFLTRYSSFISLLTQGNTLKCSSKELAQAKREQINIFKQSIVKILQEKGHIILEYNDGTKQQFDTLYSSLGANKLNELALDLGVEHDNGDLIVDEFQQTSIKGLYAAGDIVSGLNQICVAQAQGAIAASAINKYCSELD